MRKCTNCDGSGEINCCPTCGAEAKYSGYWICTVCNQTCTEDDTDECPVCEGSGIVEPDPNDLMDLERDRELDTERERINEHFEY
jgi:RecJ-like exonuclease